MDRKKYIVEASDDVKKVMAMGVTHGGAIWTDTTDIENLEELNSDYINEHFGDLQDEAYKKGLHDGESKCRYCNSYQRGLDDAWEAARKIFGYEKDGGIPIDEIGKVFGYAEDAEFCTADIIRHNTASEAIAKLKAYEEKQDDKFDFGDEIIDSNGVKGCVISMNNEKSNTMYALFGGYRVPQCICQKNYRKTGKHYDVDDIKKLLEEMRRD